MIKINGNWSNDLIWCPSQLFLNIEVDDEAYQIYCRWRHEDPWTISLIRVRDDVRHRFDEDDSLTQETPIPDVHYKALQLVEEFIRLNKHKEMK